MRVGWLVGWLVGWFVCSFVCSLWFLKKYRSEFHEIWYRCSVSVLNITLTFERTRSTFKVT